MGLIINGRNVIVDHHVKGHLLTTRVGNPTETLAGTLQIRSVFKRLKNSQKVARNRKNKLIGDNCPLVYALKGKDNLKTSITSIKKLHDDFPLILGNACEKFASQVDAIVPMPSDFPLADCLATRIARHMKIPVLRDVFRKSTNAEAYAQVVDRLQNHPKDFSHKVKIQLQNTLQRLQKSPDADYSAKDVFTKVRQHFVPLQIHCLRRVDHKRLLLVDDLLATGETLLCGQRHIINSGLPEPLHAVTWFSNV